MIFAFASGAALLALWLDTRFPKLAPDAFKHRVAAAVAAYVALELVPFWSGSIVAIYVTLFACVLPALTGAFLTALWLLRSLRDARVAA